MSRARPAGPAVTPFWRRGPAATIKPITAPASPQSVTSMPSESVAGFLDHAKASRVLFPEQIEQLVRQPDIPHSDLSALCEYLMARGVLTNFQSAAIRDGRGNDLSFAGYPVIDEIGPCPGGTAYKALHPSLRTPLELRRLRADWLAPADNPTNYLARARAVGMIAHPNLVHLLDAGLHGDGLYVVIDPPADAADIAALSVEIGGAMPSFLAAEYGRAIASALRSAHERGGAHGDIRPQNLLVGPLAVKPTSDGRTRRRPAPDAVVRLAELGLVPVRPPVRSEAEGLSPYLPPERLDSGNQTAGGDIYGLGGTLYFLLTGRPPFAGTGAELANRIRSADPQPLSSLRPDVPADFSSLVGRMLVKQSDRRPHTAYDVEAALIKFCRPGSVPPQPVAVPVAIPVSAVMVAHPVAEAAPAAAEATEPANDFGDGWGVAPNAFEQSQSSEPAKPRRRAMTSEEKARGRMLLILGGLLHLTAIGLLVAWLAGVFEPAPDTTAPPDDPKPGVKKPGDGRPKSKKT